MNDISSTPDPLAVYRAQGFGKPLGMGRNPALLVVDFVVGFTDPNIFGGGNIAPAVRNTVRLLAAARAKSLPVAFTRVVYADDGSDGGVFARKVPGLLRLTEGVPESAIVPELEVRPGDLVVRKTMPSAFFGTMLAPWLSARRVDSVLVAGCTTSGCVRASVVDAMGHGFAPLVVADGVGDRSLPQHDANLIDLAQKYADLVTTDEAVALVEAHRPE